MEAFIVFYPIQCSPVEHSHYTVTPSNDTADVEKELLESSAAFLES